MKFIVDTDTVPEEYTRYGSTINECDTCTRTFQMPRAKQLWLCIVITEEEGYYTYQHSCNECISMYNLTKIMPVEDVQAYVITSLMKKRDDEQ